MWKTIKNAPHYQCSETGHFRSLDRYVPGKSNGVRFINGRDLKVSVDAQGYGKINIKRGERIQTYSAHRLIYETFKGDIPDGYTIDHDDFNKMNNHIDNLICMTALDNSIKGDGKTRRGPKGLLRKTYGAEIIEKYNSGIKIRELAETYKCSGSYIEKIIRAARKIQNVRTTGVNIKQLLKMESQGMSYTDIAQHLNRNEDYIKKLCAKSRGECPRYKINTSVANDMRTQHTKGIPITKLAEKYNITYGYARKIIKNERK